MNKFFNKVLSFFRTIFTKSKKVVVLQDNTEEYDGWLGV